jgi:AcrR family transcriptional regulator
MIDTRNRILDVALEALGQDPDASMSDVAAAAGVVRRTVYGYFPTRIDLVRTLSQRALDEMLSVLAEATTSEVSADIAWAVFVNRLWPLTHRYRVLLALRRGEYGHEIHALLGPVDGLLADLVARGQETGEFGRHLPAEVLGPLAFSTVFSIADDDLVTGRLGADAAITTTLLLLGVPEQRARSLVRHE